MLRLGLTIAAALALAPSAGRGQAAGDPPARAPDFKVVFWLDRQGAWRHQVYDVRKGQYTRAVADWVHERNRIRYDASGFAHLGGLATVRQVFLDREPGMTEREKLLAAIRREQDLLESPDLRLLRPYQPPTPITGRPHAPYTVSGARSWSIRAPMTPNLGGAFGRSSYAPAAPYSPVLRFRPP